MSIITFGGGTDAVVGETGPAGVTEELRDERLNQQLMDAYRKKQAGLLFEALKSYTDVLEDSFLRDAKIEKHVFMRFNAHKNCGEVYEQMDNFTLAKYHYTQALKIQQKDSFVWQRLGLIEYEQFGDLKMAHACFDAAAKTLTALEKRGSRMCSILVKLAEVTFLLFDFKASELMVDTLLRRQLPDQNSLLFALLMKAHFASLKNEPQLAQECLSRAKQIQQDACVDELQVVKKMRAQRQLNQKVPIIFSEKESRHIELVSAEDSRYQNVLRLTIVGNTEDSYRLSSFPELFVQFVRNLGESLEESLAKDGPRNVQNLVLDCQDYASVLKRFKEQMRSNWVDSFVNSESLCSQTEPEDQPDAPGLKKAAATKEPQKTAKTVEAPKRGLRKKLDQDDVLVKQIQLGSFEDFKRGVLGRPDFIEITSHAQIKAIQSLFVARTQSTQATQAQPDEDAEMAQEESKSLSSQEVPNESLLDDFEKVLDLIQGKSVLYVARNLLRFIVDGQGRGMLRDALSYEFFRIYTQIVQASDASWSKAVSGLHLLDQFNSYRVVLAMFEMALFNKDVIKKTKSGPVMSHRQAIFSYLQQFIDAQQDGLQADPVQRESLADFKLKEQLARHQTSPADTQTAYREFKVRLLYAMMFYSFEIQNDMSLSVTIYTRLAQLGNLQAVGPIAQPWIAPGFQLDFQKISTFGNCKIQEAQKVRDYDSALNALKAAEVMQMRKGVSAKAKGEAAVDKYRPECINYAKFYLEQFFNYLVMALSSDSSRGGLPTNSLNAAFSSNDEKIKEMWEKLCYSLSRSQTSEMLTLVQYIFCTLTAFQLLNKSFYESFILRKLDFEKLFCTTSERLQQALGSLWQIRAELKGKDTHRTSAERHLQSLLQVANVEQFLLKLEAHMMRLFSSEFLCASTRQQNGDLNRQLLAAFFKSLFSLEMIKGCLNEPTQGTSKAYLPACQLLKCLDKLVEDNSESCEVMDRPYSRLVSFAFPFMTRVFVEQTQTERSNAALKDLLQGPLAAFVEVCLLQFLAFRVDMKTVVPHLDVASGDQEMKDSQEEGDPFSHLRQLSSASAVSQTAANGLTQFQHVIIASNLKPNVQLLADVITCLDFCMAGRLLDHGKLSAIEIKQVLRLTEVVSNTVFAHRTWLQERCPSSKERCTQIKNSFRDITQQQQSADSSVRLQREGTSCLCVQGGKKSESCFEAGFPEALSLIIFFLMNIFAQVGLPTAASVSAIIPLGQRTTFLEKLTSLHDLKKLRALIYIDLQYSEHLEVTSLLMSYVFLQYYQTSNESKLQTDHKKNNADYSDMRQFHKQASNCAIAALRFAQRGGPLRRPVWSNLDQAKFSRLATEQLLQVQMTRIRGKEHVAFFSKPLEQDLCTFESYLTPFVYLPSSEGGSKALKLRQLKEEASLYALTCQCLDSLTAPAVNTGDPRAKQLPTGRLRQAAVQVAELLLQAIDETQRETVQEAQAQKDAAAGQVSKPKPIVLSSKQAQVCQSKINQLMGDTELEMGLRLVPKEKLSSDYSYLLADLQMEHPLQVSVPSMNLYLRALESAIARDDFAATAQCLQKIIEVCLLLAAQLKYNNGGRSDQSSPPVMSQETRTRYQQVLDSVNKQVLYNQNLKQVMDRFLTVTLMAPSQSEAAAERGGPSSAQAAGDASSFQVDQESIIYDKHAATVVRQKLMKKQSLAEINQLEKVLVKLYDLGDKLVYMLTLSAQKAQQMVAQTSTDARSNKAIQDFQKDWLKVGLNQIMAKSLFYEFQAHIAQKADTNGKKGPRPRLDQWTEGWVILREMQQQTLKDLSGLSESLHACIQFYQARWNSDTTLCPVGSLKNNTSSAKYLLNLQMVQSALTQFFSATDDPDSSAGALRPVKSAMSFANFNVFTMGQLRAKVKHLLLLITERSDEYEPAREVFKATMIKAKQNQVANDGKCKFTELQATFEFVKKTYLGQITRFAENLCRKFISLKLELSKPNGSSAGNQKQLLEAYREMRHVYQTSCDTVPQVLKDVFEIFVETHSSKMFLRRNLLITGDQQQLLRDSVLKVCAVCGPESALSSATGSASSKFLNLAKLTDRDYQYEGLRICVSWFEKVLEGSATSHVVGQSQAQGSRPAQRGSKLATDLRRKLLDTFEEIERSIADNSSAQNAAMRPQNNQSREAAQALQVFQGGSLGTPQNRQ